MDITTLIGTTAAVLSTFSFYPQLRKCWVTGSAGDLSMWTFSVLASGVALWAIYGILRQDWVIIGANVVTLGLLLGILSFKVREVMAARSGG